MGEHNDELERREREEEYEEFINVYGRENEREDDLVQSLNLLKNNTMPPAAVMQRLDFLEPTSQQYTANTTNAITKPHREQQSLAALRAASASMCYIIFLPELEISDSTSVCLHNIFTQNSDTEQHPRELPATSSAEYLGMYVPLCPQPNPVLMREAGTSLPKPQEFTGRTNTK
jgi:hypothetical protein